MPSIWENLGNDMYYGNYVNWLKQFAKNVSSCRAEKESSIWEAETAEYKAAYQKELIESNRMNWEVVGAAKSADFTVPEDLTQMLGEGEGQEFVTSHM